LRFPLFILANKGGNIAENQGIKTQQDEHCIEAKMNPRPEFMAPHYNGSEKLKSKLAIIAGEILTLLGGETRAA